MKTKLLLGAGLGMCALAWAAKDPVIMTVNGVDVPKSEFEYLYHKNSQQQLTAQPLDDYVEMFVNYRLKVADAIADGVDTTASFRQEMAQYRHELAAPYMADSVLLNNLVKEAWQRSADELQVSHIMLFKRNSNAENEQSRHTLDSLRTALKDGADFADLAARYSQDRGTNQRGGDLGYITAGRYPYSFEKAAYAMKSGDVSDVVESPVGYHLIKAGARRPARGTVHVAHILLMDPQGSAPEESQAIKARIDSIYELAKADPSKFDDLARRLSDDKGTAQQGGMLPWFGSGQMVQEFEDQAFNLPVESLSEPFRTRFGWHIIYKYGQRGVPSLEEMKPGELARIQSPQDERYGIVRDAQRERLAKKHKAAFNEKTASKLREYVAANGLDSIFYQTPALDREQLLSVGKSTYSVGDFKSSLHGSLQPDPHVAATILNDALNNYMSRQLVEAEEEWLEENQPDYRNLLHEYRNGSLLYESSLKNVWNRASQDKKGLEDYFEAHRADYKWIEPRAKGILVQAKNDSIAADIARRYAELPKDEAFNRLKKEYKGEAQIDRILMAKGQNALVDALMFGEGEPTPLNAAYTVCLMLDGRLIKAPENVDDVKGQVTSDYQESLEEAWVASLREKYPVVIDRKVLKKVK